MGRLTVVLSVEPSSVGLVEVQFALERGAVCMYSCCDTHMNMNMIQISILCSPIGSR